MRKNSSNIDKPLIVNLNVQKFKFSISDLPDNEIWNEFKKGNEGAFNYIYNTYFQDIYQYGQQFTKDLDLIKDLIQDLLIDIRKNRKNLGEAPSIKFYLFKAFRRKVFRYLKQNKIVYTDCIESYSDFKIENSHEVWLIQSQLGSQKKLALEGAFLKLSIRQKEAIYYYFYQSMTYEEVALIMDLRNVKSVRNLIYKSIDVLKAQLHPIQNKLFTLLFTL